ncbi:MAG: peptidoglycan editing factor PgeF [Muribaculum sp.]|nr:peptidoglycan editing factor PgeF [Muribaculum sp.]
MDTERLPPYRYKEPGVTRHPGGIRAGIKAETEIGTTGTRNLDRRKLKAGAEPERAGNPEQADGEADDREREMYPIIRSGADRTLRQNVTTVQGTAGEELEYLTFPSISNLHVAGHLFTTRIGGVSAGDCASMNFSFSRGERRETVLENYRRICRVLSAQAAEASTPAAGVTPADVIASAQTHTTHIRRVTVRDKGRGVMLEQDQENVDGLITDEPGVVLACFFADCVPLYFVDPVRRAIGLAHSGWRGTVNGMGACMIQKMEETFGSKPSDLVAAIGPSICRECYEVGADVAEAFERAFPDTQVVTPGRAVGKYQLDLWLANRLILLRAGISETNLAVTDLCTCHNPGYLFSHRASHGKRGNLAAFLYLYENHEKA